MPIVDYRELALQRERSFFKHSNISSKNKQLMRDFLERYTVSHARRAMFLCHILKFLSKTENAKRDMHDRSVINKIFKELREELSPNYYSTVINVSNCFVRWLNEGEKPNGFKDVQRPSANQLKRKLKPQDMLTWDNGLELMNQSNSIQLKAIIATQLDGGFRPSEFVDLNYGDISVKKDFIIANVQDGKTGPRTVIIWRAVPYLSHWLQNHPTKKKKDPLWIQEYQTKESTKRYQYRAILKRIKELAEKVGIDKPVDFYNFRHSACRISKMDNVPDELAAAKFGHSIKYYVNTYGRLSPEDVLSRYSKHYGIEIKETKPRKNITCPRCKFINPPDSSICEKCGSATAAKAALELANENSQVKDELSEVKAQLDRINSFMNKLVERNPDVIDLLAEKAVSKKKSRA